MASPSPGERVRATMMQERAVRFELAGRPLYNVSTVGWHWRGPVNRSALVGALGDFYGRHEILRTSFEQHDGVFYHRVAPIGAFPLRQVELHDADELDKIIADFAAAEQGAPFDLLKGPLTETTLYVLPTEAFIHRRKHHLLGDFFCQFIFENDLRAAYTARTKGIPLDRPPTLQFREFAAQQRQRLASEGNVLKSYWKRLIGAERVKLPADKNSPLKLRWSRDVHVLRLSDATARRLQEFRASCKITMLMALLTGFVATMHRLTGQADLVIGTAAFNRPPAFRNTYGLFAENVPLRFDLSGRTTSTSLALHVRDVVQGAREHACTYPFILEAAGIQEDLSSPWPFMDVVFTLELSERYLPGLDPAPESIVIRQVLPKRSELHAETLFPLRVSVTEDGENIVVAFHYAKELFSEERMVAIGTLFERTLGELSTYLFRGGIEGPSPFVRIGRA
jgi:hypothetical protein